MSKDDRKLEQAGVEKIEPGFIKVIDNDSKRNDIYSAVITGPTGTIGTALCRNLLQKGIETYAVCRPDSLRVTALPKSELLHIISCDLTELEQLPTLIGKPVDAFFHLGWAHTIGAGRNDMSAQISNIQYTLDAVRAAALLGCRVFLGAGSQAEYGRMEGLLRPDAPCFPENGYGMAKLCAGQMSRIECQKLGMRHEWVRILSVYGPRDGNATMISTVIRALLRGEKPSLTAGEQQWDYLYADDAAEALFHVAAYGVDGRIYPVGSGQAQPLREYICTIRDQIDPMLPLGFGDLPYGEKQVMHLQADISTLTQDTGWTPKIPFSEGIQRTICWIKEGSI